MSDKHEAKIEVLTAEVRVLQVGSRQVTLSVVRQLDWVDPAEVVPFGRVRTRGQSARTRQGRKHHRAGQHQVS